MKEKGKKCIDCLYLGFGSHEVTSITRDGIKKIKKGDSIQGGLYDSWSNVSCVKGLHTKDEFVNNGYATCPKPFWQFYLEGWKLYKPGIKPISAYDREKHNSVLKWTVIGAGIGVLVLIATVYFGLTTVK